MGRKSAIHQSKRKRKQVWAMMSDDAKLASRLHKVISVLGDPEDVKKARSLCGWFQAKGFLTAKQYALGKHLLKVAKGDVEENAVTEPYYVYVISDGNHLKIGYSKEPKRRLKDLQVGNAAHLKLLRAFEVIGMAAAKAHEKTLHRKFKSSRKKGEWFDGSIQDEVVLYFDHHVQMMRDMGADIQVLMETGTFDEMILGDTP